MRRAGTDLHVVGLQQCAALLAPILLEFENDLLEGNHESAVFLALNSRFYVVSLAPRNIHLL